MSENITLGEFSSYSCKIDNNAQEAFNQVMEHIVGVQYTTVAVSSQIVNGTNYHFFCNTVTTTIGLPKGIAIVSIYRSNEGEAKLLNIKPIN